MHCTVGCVCVSGRVGNNLATSHVIVYLGFCGTKYKNFLVSVILNSSRKIMKTLLALQRMSRRIGFMVFTDVKVSFMAFWVMTTCMLMCGYRHFGGYMLPS